MPPGWSASAVRRQSWVLCSDALRTRETLDGLLQAWRARPRILYERGLYLAGVAPLLLRLQSIADDISSAWLIGHNPGLHELAQHLAASAAGRREFPVLADRFPTAARAVFALDAASWGELGTAPLAITAFELVD